MGIKKILWLEDQYKDFSAYRSALFRAGYLVEFVPSVSETVEKLRKNEYVAIIFDIKVLPGNDQEWIELDKKKRDEYPNFDSYLGLELLYSIFNPGDAKVKLNPPIFIDPRKVIVFSVVYDKNKEISSLGVPEHQVIYKSSSDLSTLPKLIEKIEKHLDEK